MDATNGNTPQAESAEVDAGSQPPPGEIFVELGFVTRAQLDAALAGQLRTGAPLGEILVEQGSLTRLDLATALADHWEPHPYPDDDAAPPSENGTAAPDGPFEPTEPTTAASAAHAAVGEIERSLAELRDSVESLAEVRTAEAVATGVRLHGAEDAVAELAARLDAMAVLVTGLRADVSSLGRRDASDEALFQGLTALGEQLLRSAGKTKNPGKHLRRSIEDLAAVIAAAEGRAEERGQPQPS